VLSGQANSVHLDVLTAALPSHESTTAHAHVLPHITLLSSAQLLPRCPCIWQQQQQQQDKEEGKE
jgi:hypothetical protein